MVPYSQYGHGITDLKYTSKDIGNYFRSISGLMNLAAFSIGQSRSPSWRLVANEGGSYVDYHKAFVRTTLGIYSLNSLYFLWSPDFEMYLLDRRSGLMTRL